jgi:hypothetical protein
MIDERECEWCGQLYRPRVLDQRFCGMECRNEGKAAEGRSARRSWWAQGRPMINEAVIEEPKALPDYRRTG